MSTTSAPQLVSLEPGQGIVYGGNRVATVSTELAAAFAPGDRIVVDDTTGAILHIDAESAATASDAVGSAVDAFGELARCSDEQITDFFERFADLLDDTGRFAPIRRANEVDVESARARGRSTTRLELGDKMRADMVAGLRGWAASASRRDTLDRVVDHGQWSVAAHRAPLGVVAFVFEGRPNVFADAAGVVRTGNTVVFRIGSDALGTAQAIVEHALAPALAESGLPAGTVSLVESAARSAGWALFADARLDLAVARGSGPAVAQLSSVARQAGVPVSSHGTGGAWVVADVDADPERLAAVVANSLDRKVCNTLNTCCVVADGAAGLVPVVLEACRSAAGPRGVGARIHATGAAMPFVPEAARALDVEVVRADGSHVEPFVTPIDIDRLGHEWEWEASPEMTLHVVETIDEATALFNAQSPRFVASLVAGSASAHRRFFDTIDAPFVGDGFTRWVDGQYALDAPELGLSNWEGGRLLGRGGVLSGDSVYTIRYRASTPDPNQSR